MLRRFTVFLSVLLSIAPAAIAQTSRPESGAGERFNQPIDEVAPLPEGDLQTQPELPEPTNSEREVKVVKVIVTGSTELTEEDWGPIVAPLLEKPAATEREIDETALELTRLYVRQGFLSTRVVPARDGYSEGIVQFRAIEGRVAAIEIVGLKGVNESYVRRRLNRATGTPLNATELENLLRLLQSGPLFRSVSARLRKGEGLGESILRVEFEEDDPFDLSLLLDNDSPISVGAEQLQTTVTYNNLTGNGDRLAATVRLTSQDGSQTYEGSYSIPINALDGTFSIRALINNNEVVSPDDIAVLDIDGEFELYEASLRQPVIRSLREELAFSLGFAYTTGRTFLLNEPFSFGLGPDEEGESTIAQIRVGQDYLRRGPSGSWLVRNQLNIGTKLFDATENDSNIPDGQFLSYLFQGRRVQLLGRRNALIIALDAQLATEPLLPVEQFSVGGSRSVRGYRQNLIAGDNGIRFSLEDRIALLRDDTGRNVLQVAPFLDGAVVWNDRDNPNELAFDTNTLVGIGLGIIWNPNQNFRIRLDYGADLVDIEVDSGNIQDDGIYFSVGWNLNP